MSDFSKIWKGKFESLLSWKEFDSFWNKLSLELADDWYIYAPGQEIPTAISPVDKTCEFLSEVSILLHKEHQERYCGIVYVDNKQKPEFIKIYDPSDLGVTCGYSDNPPLPAWVLSKVKPENLDFFDKVNIVSGNRKRWWQQIFSHGG